MRRAIRIFFYCLLLLCTDMVSGCATSQRIYSDSQEEEVSVAKKLGDGFLGLLLGSFHSLCESGYSFST